MSSDSAIQVKCSKLNRMRPHKILIQILVICYSYHRIVTKVILPPSSFLKSHVELFSPLNQSVHIAGLGIASFSNNPIYQKKFFWLRATEPKVKCIENSNYEFRIRSSDKSAKKSFLIDEHQTKHGILDCKETQYSKLKMYISDYQNLMAFYQCIDVKWADNGTDYELLVQILVLLTDAGSVNEYAALRKITFEFKELQYLFDRSANLSEFCDFEYFFQKNCNEQDGLRVIHIPGKVNSILVAVLVLLLSLGAFCGVKFLLRTFREPNRITPVI